MGESRSGNRHTHPWLSSSYPEGSARRLLRFPVQTLPLPPVANIASFTLDFRLLTAYIVSYEAEMKYVTERQRDILQFIREFQAERGVAPTHREICDRFGFSSYGTVYKHLSLLEKKGLIRRDWNQKRGVEVVEDERETPPAAGVRELPLFG